MKRIIVIAVSTIMTTTSAVAQANITTPWGSLTFPIAPQQGQANITTPWGSLAVPIAPQQGHESEPPPQLNCTISDKEFVCRGHGPDWNLNLNFGSASGSQVPTTPQPEPRPQDNSN
jgi:hypothetical protein